MVLYEKHSKNQGRILEWKLRTEIGVIVAAFLSFAGSIAAISFSNVVSHLEDGEIGVYKAEAKQKVGQAQAQAEQANKSAVVTNQSAAQANLQNTQLRIQLLSHETNEKQVEAKLVSQNKDTSDFAHALAQQQATMAEQARLSQVLTGYQINAVANTLQPFRGTDIIMHSTNDTTVLRLKRTIDMALQQAGITEKENSIDMGALYEGVSVAIHLPGDVPPIAMALIVSFKTLG